MKATDFCKMGIIPMLEAVFKGDVSGRSGPTQQTGKEEKERGVISSPISRRLYKAVQLIDEGQLKLIEEHTRLHDEEKSSAHDCKSFRRNLDTLPSRKEVLRQLLHLSIATEHPAVLSNEIALRKGWVLVQKSNEWTDVSIKLNESTFGANFVSRISDAVQKKIAIANEDKLEVRARNEEIIGSLNDSVLITIWSIASEMEKEIVKNLPPGFLGAKFSSKIIQDMTVREVTQAVSTVSFYEKSANFLLLLFSCGIRDEIPAIPNDESIGIRRGWEVVKCVPDEPSVEFVMTPFGPALSVVI